ncbi:hypothetical protein CVS40_11657 [Lucilia cuprina]|nr:hypothetical protein CVS40_11657 [Lucilia cuprina]
MLSQGQLHLHTTQGTTIRRTVGSSCEAGEAPTSTSYGQCAARSGSDGNNAIAPLSPDPKDGDTLTPAHRLIGEGLRSALQTAS